MLSLPNSVSGFVNANGSNHSSSKVFKSKKVKNGVYEIKIAGLSSRPLIMLTSNDTDHTHSAYFNEKNPTTITIKSRRHDKADDDKKKLGNAAFWFLIAY